MSLLAFDRVSVVADGVRLFDALSLAVEPEERVAIVGESGRGKSMIARLALGLAAPSSGELRLFGEVLAGCDAARLRRLRARVGSAAQGGSLIGSLSVEDNLWLGLGADPAARARMGRRLDRVMLGFGIENLGAVTGDRLSAGERRRVELARAVLRDPELLILDEPLEGAAGDAAVLERQIARQTASRGRALLLLTQDVGLAERLCERVLRVERGRVSG